MLRQQDMTAGQLSEEFDLAKATMSRHFAVLREAGLIDGTKTGTSITYRLNLSVLEEALMAMMSAFGVGSEGEKGVEDETAS